MKIIDMLRIYSLLVELLRLNAQEVYTGAEKCSESDSFVEFYN